METLALLILAVAGWSLVLYLSCKKADYKPSDMDVKIPTKKAALRLKNTGNINAKNVYDSIRSDLSFNVPLCAFGCTGERFIEDMGNSAPPYNIKQMDEAYICGFSVKLLRYTPISESHIQFYELIID